MGAIKCLHFNNYDFFFYCKRSVNDSSSLILNVQTYLKMYKICVRPWHKTTLVARRYSVKINENLTHWCKCFPPESIRFLYLKFHGYLVTELCFYSTNDRGIVFSKARVNEQLKTTNFTLLKFETTNHISRVMQDTMFFYHYIKEEHNCIIYDQTIISTIIK